MVASFNYSPPRSFKRMLFGKNHVFCRNKWCFRFTRFGNPSLVVKEFNWKHCTKHKKDEETDLKELKKLHANVAKSPMFN